MAYQGATSTAANPPMLVTSILAGSTHGLGESTSKGSWAQWVYRSTHVVTDVEGTDFIADGFSLGMDLNHSVLVISSTVFSIAHHVVNAVGSTGGVTLSSGTLVSS